MGSLIHVAAWERVSLWRRVLCAFARVGILIAFVGVLIELLGPPISIFFTARWEARKLPGVKVAPRPLADYSVSDASGTALSYFGYEFDVPWNASFKEKAFSKNGIVQIEFESGQNVTFIVPRNQSGLLTEIVQDESMHMKNLQVVFGDLMNRSPRSAGGAVEHHAIEYSSVWAASRGDSRRNAANDKGHRLCFGSRNRSVFISITEQARISNRRPAKIEARGP